MTSRRRDHRGAQRRVHDAIGRLAGGKDERQRQRQQQPGAHAQAAALERAPDAFQPVGLERAEDGQERHREEAGQQQPGLGRAIEGVDGQAPEAAIGQPGQKGTAIKGQVTGQQQRQHAAASHRPPAARPLDVRAASQPARMPSPTTIKPPASHSGACSTKGCSASAATSGPQRPSASARPIRPPASAPSLRLIGLRSSMPALQEPGGAAGQEHDGRQPQRPRGRR